MERPLYIFEAFLFLLSAAIDIDNYCWYNWYKKRRGM